MKLFNKILSLLKQYKNEIAMLVVAIVGALGYAYVMGFFAKENFGLSQTSKELVFFSMKGCGHCEEFQPTWDLLVTNYGNTAHVDLVQVKQNEKPELAEQYGVTSFPTIMSLKGGKKVKEYTGDRSYEDVVRFLTHHISN